MTLGTYPRMRLVSARVAFTGAQQALREGKDPGAQHVEARRAERLAETVTELAEDYLARYAKKKGAACPAGGRRERHSQESLTGCGAKGSR